MLRICSIVFVWKAAFFTDVTVAIHVSLYCSLCYPHPYQYELDNYVPDERFLERAEVQVGHC